MTKTPPRLVSAFLEVPQEGSYRAVRIYVKAEDGKDLTSQAILDAVSDALIDAELFSVEEYDGSGAWDA